MLEAWKILKSAVTGYIANNALSRGAAIAFYGVTSLTPILLIVVAIAGIAFEQDSVRDGLVREIGGLLGQESGDLVKSMLARSSDPKTGTLATIFGVVMLVVTASGVFGEMQSALNATWKTKAPDEPFFSMIRGRATSLGLVGALGFLIDGFACRKHRALGLGGISRQQERTGAAYPVHGQRARFDRTIHGSVCCHLQGPAIRQLRGGTSAPVRF
jgi:uncharacterized BrkB/YihY/UPF0761 family membrane protein